MARWPGYVLLTDDKWHTVLTGLASCCPETYADVVEKPSAIPWQIHKHAVALLCLQGRNSTNHLLGHQSAFGSMQIRLTATQCQTISNDKDLADARADMPDKFKQTACLKAVRLWLERRASA
eukprot:scaffold125538_cov44-Prasinocladus_malaysianus.AAC.1